MSLTWEQRKQIGEALGYRVSQNQYGGWELTNVEALRIPRFTAMKIEQDAWDAYQPDVLGEVIPWLQKNAPLAELKIYDEAADVQFRWHYRLTYTYGRTFSEATCALMLVVLESGVTA